MNSVMYGMLAGQLIDGKYHLEKMLGAGGFGAVFLANEVVRDRVLRQVAVKVIAPSGNPEKQLAELIAATNLDHPNFIRSMTAGEYNFMNISFLYLVMELAEYSLENQLQTGTIKGDALKKMIAQIATALDYLHTEKKQVHQDLKPGNVLWVNNCWKISDFGTVRQLNSQSYLQTANPVGTIPYMPPEAFQDGTVSSAGDIWSLGITIVAAITGKLPYQFTKTTELLERVINHRLELPNLPPEFDGIVRGCLKVNWQQRWTAKQVLAALKGSSVPPNGAKTIGNYTRLRDLLADKKWKEADRETTNVMLQAAGRTKEGYLDLNACRNFPPEDLRTIDQLWLEYSNGRFGFSVQKKICVDKGGKLDGSYDWDTYVKLSDQVGWSTEGVVKHYDKLTFNINAPAGHLPREAALAVSPLERRFFRSSGCGNVEGVWGLVALFSSLN